MSDAQSEQDSSSLHDGLDALKDAEGSDRSDASHPMDSDSAELDANLDASDDPRELDAAADTSSDPRGLDAGADASLGAGLGASDATLPVSGSGGATSEGNAGTSAGTSSAGTFSNPSGTGGDDDAGQSDAGVEPETETLPLWGPYQMEDTNGFVRVGVSSRTEGSQLVEEELFWTETQLWSAPWLFYEEGWILDPDEGIDDCTVYQSAGYGGSTFGLQYTIGAASLIDEAEQLDYASFGIQTYIDLTALEVEPRYGGVYGFEASGGTLPEPVTIDAITLPQPFTVTSLAGLRTLTRGEHQLTWTGQGDGVLDVFMHVTTRKLYDHPSTYYIRCTLDDDGEFTLPASVLQLVPGDGLITLYFTRRNLSVEASGSLEIVALGEVGHTYHLAFGEACERPEVVEACEAYAAHYAEVDESCGEENNSTPLGIMCPDYLIEACIECPEYYECMSAGVTCVDDDYVTVLAECECP